LCEVQDKNHSDELREREGISKTILIFNTLLLLNNHVDEAPVNFTLTAQESKRFQICLDVKILY
jgi:hypothetical protein